VGRNLPYLFFLAVFFADFFAAFLAGFFALFFAGILSPSHLRDVKSIPRIVLPASLVKTFAQFSVRRDVPAQEPPRHASWPPEDLERPTNTCSTTIGGR
jgi:hypothetical protein